MAFFKKAKKPTKTKKSLQEIPLERVLTAEGWKRRASLKVKKEPKKGK